MQIPSIGYTNRKWYITRRRGLMKGTRSEEREKDREFESETEKERGQRKKDRASKIRKKRENAAGRSEKG